MDNVIQLDEVIHQPVRTRIIAYLINCTECDYTSLKKYLGLTDGHMSTHMKVLIAKKYVSMTKCFVKNKPKTTYKIIDLGIDNFKNYLNTLKKIIEG